MLTAAMALAMAAQTSQPNPPAATDDIVVTGRKAPDREQVRRYVADISRPVDGQLANFRYPVCPGVIGLPRAQAQAVVKRIRKVAGAAGLRVDKPDCATNVSLVVIDEGLDFVTELQRQKPDFFSGLSSYELKRLQRSDDPVWAWSVTQLQNEDGMPVSSHGDVGDTTTLRVMSASIIKTTTQQAALQSFVVIDRAAAIGKTLTQLADYVTMRAVGGAHPPRQGVIGETILTLFQEDGPDALSVTNSDLAYLAARADLPANRSHLAQKNRLSRAVGAAYRSMQSDSPN